MPRWISIFCFVLVAVTKVIICETYYSEEEIKYPSLNSLENDTGFYDNNRQNKSSVCGRKGRWCLPLCCQIGSFFKPPNYSDCTPMENKSAPRFPRLYDVLTLEARSEQLRINDFQLVFGNPCMGNVYYLDPRATRDDKFKLLANGSIHFPYGNPSPYTIHYWEYCLVAFGDHLGYEVIKCISDNYEHVDVDDERVAEIDDSSTKQNRVNLLLFAGAWSISMLCLCVTYLVYSIVPEFRNMHGSTFRAYVASLIIISIDMIILNLVESDDMHPNLCLFFGYVLYFSAQASEFWLNVICFDNWWNFRKLRTCQSSIKPQKQFVIYSAYAWGCSFFLTGICVILDFLPDVPSNWITPEFGIKYCWFNTSAAVHIYLYGPMGLILICDICLFVSTAMKVVRQHKNGTTRHLKGKDRQRHDVNMQWFNIWLKFFLVMGIMWSMEIWTFISVDRAISERFVADMVDVFQGFIIFVIFVWKDKIKLLLKHLGFRDRNFKSKVNDPVPDAGTVPDVTTLA